MDARADETKGFLTLHRVILGSFRLRLCNVKTCVYMNLCLTCNARKKVLIQIE